MTEIDSGPFVMSRYLNKEDLYKAMADYIDQLHATNARYKAALEKIAAIDYPFDGMVAFAMKEEARQALEDQSNDDV